MSSLAPPILAKSAQVLSHKSTFDMWPTIRTGCGVEGVDVRSSICASHNRASTWVKQSRRVFGYDTVFASYCRKVESLAAHRATFRSSLIGVCRETQGTRSHKRRSHTFSSHKFIKDLTEVTITTPSLTRVLNRLIGGGISLCGDSVWHSALWPLQH